MPKDDDLGKLHETADWLGINDDERENFISEGMKKLGYSMRQTIEWDEPEGQQSKPASMFSRSPQQQSNAGQQRRAAGGSGQYRE